MARKREKDRRYYWKHRVRTFDNKSGRAHVTNFADRLPGWDARSAAARKFRDLVSAYITDMGGLDNCSDIKLGLLRRLAAVTVQAELIEAKMVSGEQVDITVLCTLASTTVRLSQRLGLERRTRDVSPPSVGEYLQHKAKLDNKEATP